MKTNTTQWFTATVAMVLCLFSLRDRAVAQVLYGAILGSVSDVSGAPVPGATVKILQHETNQTRETSTNETGQYSFTTIPSGTYTVTITRSGFQTFVQKEVILTINSVVRVDAGLQVGALTETIQVTGQSAALQTDRAEVRAEVTTKTLEDLPVPTGRNYQGLFRMIPGFAPPSNTGSVVSNPARGLAVSVNGTSRTSVNVRIDGASATNAQLPHLTAYVPTLDAIETVNVVTNSFDAEQGLAGGAAINVQIRSGTNSIHGSAFEYHTDNVLKAKPFFLPAGERKPKAINNQFGGSLGGPIRKDKLFYFFSVERTLDRQTAALYTTVPSAAVHAGDLSASPNPVYDPLTGSSDGSGRTPFVNKIVPKTRWDPKIDKVVAAWPMPTLTDRLTNNYYATGPYKVNRNVLDAKFNWNASDKLTVSGRQGWLKYNMSNPAAFGDNGPPISSAGGRAGTASGNTLSTSVAATYVARPNLIFDGNFGLTLLDTLTQIPRQNEKVGRDVLGIPGTNDVGPNAGGWPRFAPPTYTAVGNANGPIFYHDPEYQYVLNGNWSRGRHNIRFGTDISRRHLNHYEAQEYGVFNFSGGSTSLKGGPSPNQYNGFADLLLGLTSSISKEKLVPDLMTIRTWSYSLYLRDQWQLSRKLTLSYGMRWEYFPMGTRSDHGMERYLFDTNKLQVCGVGGVPTDCGYEISKKSFAPRVGIAYRPTETFVIRAGYGITYDPYPLAFVRDMITNYPVVIQYSLSAPNSLTWASRVQDGISPPPPPDISKGTIDLPGTVRIVTLPQYITRNYIQSWNFTMQKQLPWGFTAQAGYVATRQVKQNQQLDLNVGDVGGGQASQAFYQKFGRTAATVIQTPVGHMKYDSLQATVNRRFSRGVQFAASYTLGKNIGFCCDDLNDAPVAIQIPKYWKLNRSIMPADRTHTLSLSGIAELPFGKGRRWASQGIASKIVGGWQVNALLSSYTGAPFNVTSSTTPLNVPGSVTQRADLVKSQVQILGGTGPGQWWFDPTAFAPVTQARFGTAGFSIVRGPGLVNLDFGLFRELKIRENITAQIRMEAFNATNTPHFSNPGGNVNNLQLNTDGTVKTSGGFSEITSTSGVGREGIDERVVRFGLHLRF